MEEIENEIENEMDIGQWIMIVGSIEIIIVILCSVFDLLWY